MYQIYVQRSGKRDHDNGARNMHVAMEQTKLMKLEQSLTRNHPSIELIMRCFHPRKSLLWGRDLRKFRPTARQSENAFACSDGCAGDIQTLIFWPCAEFRMPDGTMPPTNKNEDSTCSLALHDTDRAPNTVALGLTYAIAVLSRFEGERRNIGVHKLQNE